MNKGIVWAVVMAVGLLIFLPMEGMAREPRPKDPLLHALASFVVPGLGQYLNDEPDKALAHFLVAAGIWVACPFVTYPIPDRELRWRLCALLHLGWHTYSAVDAYETAKRLNEQYSFTFALPQPALDFERRGKAYVGKTIATFSYPAFITSLTLPGLSLTGTAEPAFQILGDLVARKRQARIKEGAIKLVTGVGIAVVGGIIESRWWTPPWISLAIGGAYAIGGIITLAFPSELEREYERILAMAPPERETHSVITLRRLADAAYERRMWAAIVNIASGTAFFLWSFYQPSLLWYLISLSNLGTGVYYLLVPSEEERALQIYQELKGLNSSKATTLGRLTAYNAG